jgi:hypothetical protein
MQAIALSSKIVGIVLLSIITKQTLVPVHAQSTPQPNPSPTPADPKASEPAKPTEADAPRFSCQVQNGKYMVMYQPKSQPGKQFAWAAPSNMGGGWSADRRCYEISRRLESYRPDGLLEMRTAVENGYNIICATTEKNPTCRIVLTVPQGQDPIVTRDRVFGNLTTADSGQQTTAVNTYAPRGNQSIPGLDTLPEDLSKILSGTSRPSPISTSYSGIYLKPFLDPADGGTGTGLSSLSSSDSVPTRRLNPNNFR